MTLLDGQMVGGLRRRAGRGGVRLEVDLFCDVPEDGLAALAATADRYGRFLGADATLVVA
jgi:hypothetical protein